MRLSDRGDSDETMMKGTIALAAAMAILAPNLSGAGPVHHKHPRKTAAHHRPAARSQDQIARTVLGCVPVPRGCTQTEGRTFWGMPTGRDVIVCPPGVAPFR
jgi:hypothetical protein